MAVAPIRGLLTRSLASSLLQALAVGQGREDYWPDEELPPQPEQQAISEPADLCSCGACVASDGVEQDRIVDKARSHSRHALLISLDSSMRRARSGFQVG